MGAKIENERWRAGESLTVVRLNILYVLRTKSFAKGFNYALRHLYSAFHQLIKGLLINF